VLLGVWLVVLVVVSEVVVVDDAIIEGALPVTMHEQVDEMRDEMLWHCDT
jgi:hypothetical protein